MWYALHRKFEGGQLVKRYSDENYRPATIRIGRRAEALKLQRIPLTRDVSPVEPLMSVESSPPTAAAPTTPFESEPSLAETDARSSAGAQAEGEEQDRWLSDEAYLSKDNEEELLFESLDEEAVTAPQEELEFQAAESENAWDETALYDEAYDCEAFADPLEGELRRKFRWLYVLGPLVALTLACLFYFFF